MRNFIIVILFFLTTNLFGQRGDTLSLWQEDLNYNYKNDTFPQNHIDLYGKLLSVSLVTYQNGTSSYIYLSGTTIDPLSQDKKVLLMKFLDNGTNYSTPVNDRYGSLSTNPANVDINTGLDVDGMTGNPYLTGLFNSPTALFPLPGGFPLNCTNPPYPDIFVMKGTIGGSPTWLLQSGSHPTEMSNDIVLDSKVNPYITGDIMGECILGNFTLNSINPLSTDAFVARIIDDGASASFKSSQMHPVQQAKTDANHEINLYPNPNNGIFTLQISKGFEEIKEICVYTIVGNMVKQIQQSLTGNSSVNLDLRDLPNGIYLIKVKTNNNSWTKKVILN